MDSTAETSLPVGEQRPKSLLDMPRNVRLQIYSHAVEPFVLFMLTRREDLVDTRPSKTEHAATAGFCRPNRRLPSHNYQDDSWDPELSRFKEGPSEVPTLAFRVSTFSPLLLVSKQVSSEVSHWTKASGLQTSVHTTIRRCVFGNTVDPSQDPDFVRLLANSRLILSRLAKESILFLGRMPTEIGRHIHSVVIHRPAMLSDDGPTSLAWSRKKTQQYSDFTEALRVALPNLRELAIHMPLEGSDNRTFDSPAVSSQAGAEAAEMLVGGIIDTLRLLYRESYGAGLCNLDHNITLAQMQATECLACGTRQSWLENGTLKRCNRCLKAYYCAPACQKTDWRYHRAWCKEADEAERRRPQRDPRLPRFNVVLEEHIDEDSDKALLQTAVTPRNRWMNYKSVLVLTRASAS